MDARSFQPLMLIFEIDHGTGSVGNGKTSGCMPMGPSTMAQPVPTIF